MANILFVDQYAVMGGGQRILLDLAGSFARDGHCVRAIFPEKGPIADVLTNRGVETGVFALPVLHSGQKGLSEKLRYLTGAPRAARSIGKFLSANRFDFLYVNGPRAMLPATLASRRVNLPLVAAVHLIHEGQERRLLDWCFSKPNVKLVSFCSRYAAEPFGPLAGKGKVLPNWVAPEFLVSKDSWESSRTALAIGNEDLAIGVLGRVSKTKGQRLFLDAAMPLLDEFPHLRLLMAGGADFEDPQEELNLKALASPKGDRVRFLDKADAVGFLDALDVSVVPSIRPESFGLVAVESMARGKAVVATRRGGLQETVSEGAGILVEPVAAELAAVLESLARDPDVRKRLGMAGRKRVEEHFSPQVLIPKAMRTILEAIA